MALGLNRFFRCITPEASKFPFSRGRKEAKIQLECCKAINLAANVVQLTSGGEIYRARLAEIKGDEKLCTNA
jgi:hypothetical protein